MKKQQTNENDIALIQKAFNALERHRESFQTMYRMYCAKYDNNTENQLTKNNLSKVYVPLVRNIVNIIASNFNTAFFGGQSPIECRPIISDNLDAVSDLNRLVEYYYKKANPKDELLKAIRSALVYGFGAVQIYWDETKKQPTTKCVNIMRLALEPECENLRDANYVCAKFFNTYAGFLNFFEAKALKHLEQQDKNQQIEIQAIFHKQRGSYLARYYCHNILIEEIRLEKLPFIYGYALQKLSNPNFDRNLHFSHLNYLGESLPRLLVSMQEEINQKRNLKLDIDQMKLNPKIVYTDGFDPSVFQKGPGASVKVVDINGYRKLVDGAEINIDNDLMTISREAQEATGINSIHLGSTSPSDRRAASSLAIINSNSSVRIEEMISTIVETLFSYWAQRFVHLVVKHAEKSVKQNLAIVYDFKELDTFVNINFGSTISTIKRIQSLQNTLQILSQNPNTNPQIINNITKEILLLELGDSYLVEKILKEENNEGVL